MSSNKNIEDNDSLDPFSSYFREQLRDYPVEVDQSLWNDLEKRIANGEKKRKRISPFWWFSGVASVAVILLLFLFLKPEEGEKSMSLVSISGGTNSANPIDITDTISSEKKTDARFANHKPKMSNRVFEQTQVAAIDSNIHVEPQKEVLASENPSNDSTHGSPSNTRKKAEISDKPLNPASRKIEERLLSEIESAKTAESYWTLALNTGTGTTTLNRTSDRISDISTGIPTDGGNLSSEKKDFTAPLSFGLTLRRNYSNKLRMETGIIYTYLRTKISPSSSSPATLDLHYLGIPLNLSYSLWKINQWEIYWSVGGTVEKGIRSRYTTNSSTKHESIRGLQWSVQTSPGISYMLKKPIGLYLEPKLSYYFDNDQPLSIRTEHPLVLGIHVGLHYDF
jgi:Outer membrane protein beta-barrel domain